MLAPNGDTYNISTTAQANSGKKAVTTDPLGHATTVIYDMLGRETETIDGNGNHAYKEYDSAGRVVSEKTKILGKDAIKKYKYDNNGNVLKESIKNNKPGEETSYRNIYYKYDRMNRLISTNTDEEGETKYTYDAVGNILTMTTGVTNTDPGVTTRYQYSNDARSLLVKLTDPMGYTETYTYDGNGNVLTKTDKNGTVTTNTYNGINNILSSTASARGGGGSQDGAGESTISYEYMQWGSLVKSITNATGTVTYGYNNKGIVTSETSTADNTSKSYTYDKNGNQTNLTISQNGSQLINQTNTFNSVGQLTQVYDAKNSKTLASYTYDNAGNVTSKETANGMQKTTYSYNESNLLTKVQNMSIGNQQTGQFGTYSSYAYEYYFDGNRSKETDNIGKTKAYTYDGAGRLLTEISARGGGGEQDGAGDSKTSTYKYDARGNRIEKRTTDTEMEEYTYDKNNRLIHRYLYYSYINNSFEYKYDNNGNLTEKTVDEYYDEFDDWDGDMRVVHVNKYDISYTYNFFNQLTGVNRTDICKDYAYCDDTSIAYYTYDPTGQRISKTVDGVTTNHIWDNNGNIVVENDTVYNRGLGGEILSAGDNYYAYNGHGDTTNLVQNSANSNATAIIATYEYDAFGNCLATGGEADNNPFRYNGQYTDEETGFVYLRNRYYDPSIGRFTQKDPYWNVNNMIYGDKQYQEGETKIPDYSAIAQSNNLYVYCMNNPMNLSDLLGMVAGDHFKTADDAAIDWAWNFYHVSLVTMLEHAALIYYSYDEYGNMYYSYTETMAGSPNNVKTNELDKHIDEGKYCVGAVHSHTVTNKLSEADAKLAVDQEYAVFYVVGESEYSDGVDICKIQNYYDGNGYQYQPVIANTSYRMLSSTEINNVIHHNSKYKRLINYWYNDIEYNYYLRSIRGY